MDVPAFQKKHGVIPKDPMDISIEALDTTWNRQLQEYIPETKDPLHTLPHLKRSFEEIARLKYDERIIHKAENEKRHIDTVDTSVKCQRSHTDMSHKIHWLSTKPEKELLQLSELDIKLQMNCLPLSVLRVTLHNIQGHIFTSPSCLSSLKMFNSPEDKDAMQLTCHQSYFWNV